jgi:pyruvate dehydrogenase E1 component alpha subunit
MLAIRLFEERVNDLYTRALMPGLAHLYIGQEAVAVGICHCLRKDDYVLGNHRSHHHCLAKGVDMKEMMAELMGKATGTNKGKGGTMHIADKNVGMLGANGVIGSNVPVAAGAALSAKIRGTDQVAVVFFGDGGANQGALHEAMNLAAIWNLGVIFVCENNRYAESTPVEYSLAGGSVANRASAYGIVGETVDGQDVLDVSAAMERAVNRARAGEGPSIIEAMTYRYYGHHGADDPLRYRTKDEEDYYRNRDCIVTFKTRLLEEELSTEHELQGISASVLVALDEAVQFADDSPWPDPEELVADVYVSY